MTGGTLIKRSLRFFWRTHLSVVLAAAVSTAVLVGALTVGDSVRGSLRALALARLGRVHHALAGGDRYFRTLLAEDIGAALKSPVAPVLLLNGSISNGDGTARVNRAAVIGTDERFWSFGADEAMFGAGEEEVVLNERLAERLGARAGDMVVIRVEKPSALPRDAPLSKEEDSSVAFRVVVKGVVGDERFGRFSLQANQIAPYNVYVPMKLLQERVGLSGRVNTLLVGSAASVADAQESFRRRWTLADAELELRALADRGVLEVRSSRVFIDPPAAAAALEAAPEATGVLTYFVNNIHAGVRDTPYSIVTAMGPASAEGGAADGIVPPEMADDEILLSAWLAEDLEAKPGDAVYLRYFVAGPMRQLHEKVSRFTVRGILAAEGPWSDPTLMPEFPGLSDAENCRDWKAGIPIDFKKIRDKDEKYWDKYRGTPKAFVTLKAGRRMWSNRFGDLTALRWPAAGEQGGEKLADGIRRRLAPESLGLYFRPVREEALRASREGIDFGQLFLGLSFFLVVAAVLLMSLLFVFGIEQRREEIGTLLALGFSPARVRHLLVAEGGVLALVGGAIGVVGGIAYTRTVLYGLSTVWQGAVSTSALRYHAEPATLATGFGISVVVALIAMWLSLRKQAAAPARELLAAGAGTGLSLSSSAKVTPKPGIWIAAVAVLCALGILALAGAGRDRAAAGAFFVSGLLLLIGGLGLSHALLALLQGLKRMTLAGVGLRNSARRRGRSLATVGLLAFGSFLIVAVSANRLGPEADAERRGSGTGGFALFAESSLPVFSDFNTSKGRQAHGLEPSVMVGVHVLALRVRDGDDASCLNLNRAQTPRLVGVDVVELQSRRAFTFVKRARRGSDDLPWTMLRPDTDGDADTNIVPAVGDEATIVYGLGMSLGDRLTYTDGRGQAFEIEIVGILANSILQGSLVISEEEFVRRFPAVSGYRMFLIDASPERAEEVRKGMSRSLQNVGFEVVSAQERLDEFSVVQNTYLSIFQALGGLGLLLGSVGLGMVVLRNVMERRGELALLRAVGYRRGSLKWLVLCEHWWLLLLGLGCGVVSALMAVMPALLTPGATVPIVSLSVMLLAVVASGVAWTWLATVLALRGPLLAALRNE